MTYLLIMMGIVGMLFATDGGRDFEALVGEDAPRVTLKEAQGSLKRLEWIQAPEGRFGLYRIQLEDGRQCLLGRTKQGMDCSSGALESFGTEVAALKQFHGDPPSPRLFRVRLSDGVECVGNLGHTALSCRFDASASGDLPELETNQAFGGDEKDVRLPRFYQAQFTDGTVCVLPRAKNAIHCRWGP